VARTVQFTLQTTARQIFGIFRGAGFGEMSIWVSEYFHSGRAYHAAWDQLDNGVNSPREQIMRNSESDDSGTFIRSDTDMAKNLR
jgi:hypothetical protein